MLAHTETTIDPANLTTCSFCGLPADSTRCSYEPAPDGKSVLTHCGCRDQFTKGPKNITRAVKKPAKMLVPHSGRGKGCCKRDVPIARWKVFACIRDHGDLDSKWTLYQVSARRGTERRYTRLDIVLAPDLSLIHI